MSQRNDAGKRDARARMQRERAGRQARARKLRTIGTVGAVLAVLIAAVVVGILVQNGRSVSYRAADAPAGTSGSGRLVVAVGASNAPAVLTVYEDPRCPACGAFEKAFHTTVNQLLTQGKVRVQYHVVSFIDRHDDGSGSKNGARALACAQNAGRFHEYHDVLYANQPGESDDAWADTGRLTALAQQVPGLDGPTFESCVTGKLFSSWVTAVQTDFDRSGYASTPTVLLNGISAYPTYHGVGITPGNLVSWVEAADRSTHPGSASPSSSPTGG